MADNNGAMESPSSPVAEQINNDFNDGNHAIQPRSNLIGGEVHEVLTKRLPIYKAAINNDWEKAKCFFEKENIDWNARITLFSQTPLQIAVGTNSSQDFVKELVDLIMKTDPGMLRTADLHGDNALHDAAKVGNTEAVKLLVNKDPDMAHIANKNRLTALQLAAACGQKETLCYLLKLTKDEVGEDGTSPYRGERGADLLGFAISADFYDVALYLVNKYPDLVMEKNTCNRETGLQTLAAKPNAFRSGIRLGFWQRIIYSWIPAPDFPDMTTLEWITNPNRTYKACNGLNVLFWRVLQYIAPPIKKMHDCKVKHIQAENLVKQMCSAVLREAEDTHDTAFTVMGKATSTAVKHGIHELIEECIHQYPSIIWYPIDELYLFQAAVKERQEKVYNLIYQMSGHRMFILEAPGKDKENVLHFAGKLSHPHRLDTVTGAALQMQRELQWFKEVEKAMKPTYKEALNNNNKTPRMVFTEEHKDLLKEAKQWMKDTSSSATVVAALIVTVAFAAIFTAPGGTLDGKPLFLNDGVFILFAISDAIALFSSSTSVLMFLSILNSRFAEDDFLYALPKRLTIGQISLFISLAATMVAFSATLALLLRDKIQWIAVPVILLAIVPVTLFLWLQFPLLVELVRSTYGKGIFKKQRNLLLH